MELPDSPPTGDLKTGSCAYPRHQSVEGPNQASLSTLESMPQEILDAIVCDLTWKETARLIRVSRNLYERLVYGLYRSAVPWNKDLLTWACEKGHLKLACYLGEYFYDVNELVPVWFPWGEVVETTALHMAVYWWNTDIAVTLINDFGADVNAKDGYDRPVLLYARSEEIVEFLLDAGADASAGHHWGSLLLQILDPHELVPQRDGDLLSEKVVALLVEKGGADPNVGCGGRTPLVLALEHGVAMVETLLRLGAEPNSEDFYVSPLAMVASRPENLRMVELLLYYGAAVNLKEQLYTPWSTSTPLIEAVCGGSVDITKLILAEGADVNRCALVEPTRGKGWAVHSPLSIALSNQAWTIVELLQEAGADFNNPQVDQRADPVHLAASELDVPMLDFLFERGALVPHESYEAAVREYFQRKEASTNWDGIVANAAGLWELQQTCYTVLEMLVKHGKKPEALHTRFVENSLFIAIEKGDEDIIRKVWSHGADINAKHWRSGYYGYSVESRRQIRGCSKYTPLHHALLGHRSTAVGNVHNRSLATIRCLFDCGANPLIGYGVRNTPLATLIKQCEWWEELEWDMAQCLLEHKCGGPVTTARFPTGLLARFLSQAVVSLKNGENLVERIELFAKLTNIKGRWGPDGLSGLRQLTSRPEYWREPRLRHNGVLKQREKLIRASKIIAKLCQGGCKQDWSLIKALQISQKPKVGDPVNEDWTCSLNALFDDCTRDHAQVCYQKDDEQENRARLSGYQAPQK